MLCWTALWVFATPALAQGAPAAPGETYALLVGSNPGGPGQAELRYAERDAQRFADVLTQLGRFTAAHTRVLLAPDRTQLMAALDSIGQALAADRARGKQAQLVFYYSGHARANAIQFGGEQLPLSELRERILALPATLTLVVLDACQSGEFTRVKGAQPAAAFSYNSAARLRTSGVAVMASSTASELSQESDSLQGSFFTHHLLVALRGAGDRDRDGVVSLAEAYRYAYDRTLSATARTAVGGQHVTLETSLTGQGEVPITYPSEAAAQLELDAVLDADLLVERKGLIFAEVHKAAGSMLRLALPAGEYAVVLRRGAALAECTLALTDGHATRLATRECKDISEAEARTKGYSALVSEPQHEAWTIELTIGSAGFNEDAYTRRLQDFGFSRDTPTIDAVWRLQLTVGRQVARNLSVLVDVHNADAALYRRSLQSTEGRVIERFAWWGLALGAHLRAHVDAFGDRLRLYAQLGAGVGGAHSKLGSDAELQLGPTLAATAGVFYMPFRQFGFVAQARYEYAPWLRNELRDTHDSGGLTFAIGVRLRTWSSR